MAKKSKPRILAAQAVEGQILKVEFDCSSWIGDVPLDQWTHGPILPVGANQPAGKNGKRPAKGRKKKT